MTQFKLFGAALSLAVVLAACGGGSGDPTPNAGTYSVSGTLATLNPNPTSETSVFGPWTGGAGTIRASADSTGAALASGTVVADGSFSVALPTTIADANLSAVSTGDFDLSGENCTGSLNVSGQGALVTSVTFFVDSASIDGDAMPTDLRLVYGDSASPTPTNVVAVGGDLLYVNAATTISGQQTCMANGVKLTTSVNLQLQPGYNKINFTLTTNADNSGSLNVSTGNWPSRWIVGDASVLPQSLNKANTTRRLLERQAAKLLPWR